jgi:hypothetical protein
MKTLCSLLLSAILSTHLAAQTGTVPVSSAPAPVISPMPALSKATLKKISEMTPLFNGRDLDGWIQAPPYPSTLSTDDITGLASLARKLIEKSDGVSAYLNGHLDEAIKADLAAFSPASTNARSLKSALAKSLNKIVSGPSIYDKARFQHIPLRPATTQLLEQNPQGQELARLNRLLLEDSCPNEVFASPSRSWIVKDGAMASMGAGRGTIYTKEEYGNYRLIFTLRHISGQPDHAPCILIFCTAPPAGEKGLDALGGIQFQPPNGGSWDYRPGKNNSGKGLFTRLVNPKFNPHEWHRVELLVNAETGTARMAVAQPPDVKAVEVLDFNDPTAAKKGPIVWQMHNKGLFDEFRDVRIEVDPKEDRLITAE